MYRPRRVAESSVSKMNVDSTIAPNVVAATGSIPVSACRNAPKPQFGVCTAKKRTGSGYERACGTP